MIKKESNRMSFLTPLSRLVGGRYREQKLGRLQLFGMGGTLGYGIVRHCDTWNVGEETPDRLTVRQEIREIAEKRRDEAAQRMAVSDRRQG
jgi:hypothetical protein